MRMTLRVNGKYYYDIGLRGKHNHTSIITRSFGEDHPKFLEDFIKLCGKKQITIISYGDLVNQRHMIKKLLE